MTDLEKAKQQAAKKIIIYGLEGKTAWKLGWDAAVQALTRKHVFWGAGESDCPRDIKAPNGELHTLRCKVCGSDRPKSFCLGPSE